MKRIVVLTNAYGEILFELERTKGGFYKLPDDAYLVLDVGDVMKVKEIEAEED